MRFEIFLPLFFIMSAQASELTLNSKEESVLYLKDEVVATNCSPSDLGQISRLDGYMPTNNHYILKFTPFGRAGNLVCKALTKSSGILTIGISLDNAIKNPMAEIPLVKSRIKVSLLNDFKRFIQGDFSTLTEIKTKGVIKTTGFKYEFIKKFQGESGRYLYLLNITPLNQTDKVEGLNTEELSPILFSHFKDMSGDVTRGISGVTPTQMYLMSKAELNPKTLKRYLR